ncbi:competence protein CoiA family protein [Nocardia brasiliensis]
MTAALTPGREYVDITHDVVFATWHGRAGLTCLGCKDRLTVVTLPTGTRFLRHESSKKGRAGAGEHHGGEETYLHNRAKYWVRNQLRSLGMTDAEVERPVARRTPDVSGHHQGRLFAVEVQWSPLAEGIARERTAALTAAGVDDLVWLTQDCDWVSRLPALGITDFDPAEDEYEAPTGFYRGHARGIRETPHTISSFLRQWINDELCWAHIDLSRRGWATVTDWEQRTRQQSTTITDLKRQLDDRATEISGLESALGAAATSEERAAQDLVKAAIVVDQLKDNNRRLTRQLREETAARHTVTILVGVLGVLTLILLVLLILL